jgi:colanic acid biosynthesis glycosyl transferase WcaI
MKKILIISQYFPPDMSGGGTRAYNYAKCLSKNYDVTVITAFPHLHTKIPSTYRYHLMKKEKMDKINIIRVRVPSILHDSIKNRIFLHLSFLITSLIPLFSQKPDVIFASEPNLFSIIPAFFYSKLRGGKVIRVVDDLWPEVIYERGFLKSKLIKKFLNKLANFSYNFPQFILPLTEEAKKHIIKFYNINPKKIIVIEHGVDTDIFQFKEKKSHNNFTIMYSGALVESYDFEILLQAAEKLKDKNFQFIIRGKGLLLEKLEKKKHELNLKNLIIDSTFIENEKLSSTLSIADIFLVPMKDDYFLNLSLPTKILEYQALGRPIICCSNGAPGNYVEDTNSGIKIPSNNLLELVDAIENLRSNSVFSETLGKNGRNYVFEHLTFEKIGMKLSKLVEVY